MDARRRMSVLVGGFAASQMLYVAARLKVADALAAGPRPIDDLAAEVGARPEPLLRILRALAAFGVFEVGPDGTVANTPMSEHLRAGADESLRELVLLYGDEHYHAMSELLQAVKRGGTAFEHAYRKPHFSYLADHPEAAGAFYDVVAATRRRSARAVAQEYDFTGAENVVEISGGAGQIIRAVLHANPNARGVLAESAGLARRARGRIHAEGLSDRCEVESLDVFESVPRDGDVYVLGHVLHGLEDDRASLVLRNCARAMASGAHVLVVERLLPEAAHVHVDAQEAFIHDAVAFAIYGGRSRTESELRALISAAGLRTDEVRVLDSGDCLLIATAR
jgi:O-methyltransferase domain/Dimerisation domain